MRAMNLANALVDQGYRVILWSSAFYHQEKRHRSRQYQSITIQPQLEIRLIPSSGYQRNVSFQRLWDHLILAWNLNRQLGRTQERPDIIFAGYPPIEAAAVMVFQAKRNRIPIMLDVKDQWPTLLVESVPSPMRLLAKMVLWPYFLTARYAMRHATGISAMSDQFLQWSRSFSGRTPVQWDRVVPLTTPEPQVADDDLAAAREWWGQRGITNDGRVRLIFVGSFSRAFDFAPIFQTAEVMSRQQTPFQIVLCGDGEQRSDLQQQASETEGVEVIEWIDRPRIVALAACATAALAPYHATEDFNASIPNKIIDAMQLGLPVLSPLGGEVRALIERDGIGLSYGAEMSIPLWSQVQRLIDQSGLGQELSDNARKLYQHRFQFDRVYDGLIGHLERLVEECG